VLVRDFLETTAARLPGKTALVCDGGRFTYAALDRQANSLAQTLLARGVVPGDRVVIHLPNSAAAVVSIFAALKAGAVFVPVNAGTRSDKLSFILHNCRATALITGSPDSTLATPWLRMVLTPGDLNEAERQHSAACPPRTNRPEDLACLVYTSGSTGRPKGVMCEHRNVVFASGAIIQYLENRESDIVLCALPLSFDYGLYQLLMTFRFGGTLVLENSFAFPALLLDRMVQERITGLPGVPTIFTLLQRLDLSARDLASLRYLTNTAAALSPGQVLELQRTFPQAKVFSMYGLTETKRALYMPPDKLEQRPGSVGIPIPGTDAWIEDEEGRRLPFDRTGELVIAGPHVMRGYWEDPDATARRFRSTADGGRVCCTGDLFRQDGDGFFYFVARKDDIIKSRGEKVAPKEIELALLRLPGVVEAAVIGVPDPVQGHAIKAFVVGSRPLNTREVLAHCRASLEDFMVPREIEFCDALPKNASGKIDKTALRSQVPDTEFPVPESGRVTRVGELETRNAKFET
jgi:long-chain acyl-CoA synthetase